jgi:iron complex outermembrane recepter protein
MRLSLIALLTSLASVASFSQVAETAPAQPINSVVVTATRVPQQGFDLPMAIDRIDGRELSEGRLQTNLSEMLGRVPGIAAQNRQNYAQDLQISIRGFGARATFGVRGVRLIADGIPATMPDGQGQAATFNLSSADRVEVLRGPFSSLYGNASGGVVQVFTADGPEKPQVRSSLFAGSDGLRKFGVNVAGQQDALNYVVDTSRLDTDGYRDHSAARRDQLNAKLKIALPNGKLTLIGNSLDQPDTQDPSGLTRAQMLANPRQVDAAVLAFNARKSIRQNQIGAVYEVGDAGKGFGSVQAKWYGGARQITQYLSQEGNLPLSAGGVVDLDRDYTGVGVNWTRRFIAGTSPLTLTAGVEGDRMDERRRGFVNSAGIAGALKRDEDDRVANRDFFLQGEWQLSPDWSASGGLRHSRVSFNIRDYYVVGANPDDSGSADYVRTTPVAGVLYRMAPRWNLYANYGGGFETPTFAELSYRPGGLSGLNFALRPAISRHREIGLKGQPGGHSRVQVSLFRIDTTDEIVTNASSGGRTDFRNAASTRREGVEMSGRLMLPGGFEAHAAWTGLDARFASGNRLPGIARSVLTADLIWRHATSGFHAALEARASSRVFVDDANSDAADSYRVAHLRAGWEREFALPSGNGLRLSAFVRIENVTDRRYAGSVIVAEARGRYFEPAPGRNYLIGLTAAVSF